jgi:hypothetical protein
MATKFIRCINHEKAVIVFLNDTTIIDPYEATEDGQNWINDIKYKQGQQANVELMQENNDRYQVMFVDNLEAIGWVMKSDIQITD